MVSLDKDGVTYRTKMDFYEVQTYVFLSSTEEILETDMSFNFDSHSEIKVLDQLGYGVEYYIGTND